MTDAAYNHAYYLARKHGTRFSVSQKGPAVIIHDPDAAGGFAAGAEMNHVGAMLALAAFTPGTILSYGGARFEVRAAGAAQRLVRYGR